MIVPLVPEGDDSEWSRFGKPIFHTLYRLDDAIYLGRRIAVRTSKYDKSSFVVRIQFLRVPYSIDSSGFQIRKDVLGLGEF